MNQPERNAAGMPMSELPDFREVLARFERELLSGARPRIEEFASVTVAQDASALLEELVRIEIAHRSQQGDSVSFDEYLTRFPALAASTECLNRLCETLHKPAPALRDSQNDPTIVPAPGRAAETLTVSGPPGDTHNETAPPNDDALAFLKRFLAPAERATDLGRLGEYAVLRVLGKGGMGIVLAAEDTKLQRQVAIKLMRPEIADSPDAKERFLREARSAAAVEHPRIVVIHQVGEWNGAPFLVMPLMAGRSLATRLKAGPALPLNEAARFLREAADGLVAAHAKGLIHRDIKPDNIWLEDTAEGTHVRLLDFGLARISSAQALTLTGGVIGTPNYMAPEQAAGQAIDPRADLFSLGCVMYEMLTGKRAFQGPTLTAVLLSLSTHCPPPVKDIVPSVPESLSGLTMRLLEKKRDNRPASAGAVSEELRRIEKTLETGNDTTAAWTPSDETIRPRNSGRKLAIMGLLVVGVSGLAIVGLRDRAPQSTGSGQINSVQTNSGGTGSGDTGTGKPAQIVVAPPEKVEGPDGAGPKAVSASATPLKVTEINVHHFSQSDAGDVAEGLLGKTSFAPRLGDRVQVTASLSKPAYAFLIAYRPDGVADLCFPDSEDTPPPLTASPRYPPTGSRKAYGLREGAGLWAFAVVASETPLPAYRDWLAARQGDGGVRWKAITDLAPGIVWWDDGESPLKTGTANGLPARTRGMGEDLEGPAAVILELTDSLRCDSGTAAAVVGFCVVPSGK